MFPRSERTTRSLSSVLALVAFLFVTASVPVFGQQDQARLEGVVRDPNGAVVAGATVTVRSPAQGFERVVTASEDGLYSVPQLRPGTYTVTVANQGFNDTQVNDLVLGVGQVRTLDIDLVASGVSTDVTIIAGTEGATIDSSSNRLGVNVTGREVAELPVNGRNFSQLQLLTPGATNSGTGNFNEVRFNARSNQQNQTRLDGVESSAIFDSSPGYLTVQGSQFRLQTSLENIQEFRVDSSNYPAEYGTGTGGQINVVGKSGTNDYHGALFYYLRNDALDARNFFDGAEKSPLRLNQFGGSIGGPVVKNRVFFFGSYEGLRQRAGFNIIELTPSLAARNFINFAGTTDPRGLEAAGLLGLTPTTADLARIQALRASGAINAFPLGAAGTEQALGGVNNVVQTVQRNLVAALDEDAISMRVDGTISDRLSIYARYQRSTGDLNSPDGATGRVLQATQQPDNFVMALQQVYSPTILNETKIGVNRAPTTLQTVFPAVPGATIDFSRTALSLSGGIVLPGVNGGAQTGLSFPGGLTRQSSAGNGRAQPIDAKSLSLIDNLSVTRGNHAMKFGMEIRDIYVDFDQLGGLQFTYGNLRDFVLNQNVTASFIGDLSAPGDFRVATNPVSTISRPFSGYSRGRQYYTIFYGQDEWRIRQNLTLNYGLRYEYYSPNRELGDRVVLFDAASGRLQDPTTQLYKSSKTNFGPRLALTYSPARFGGKTVFRVGGGLYYGPGQYEDLIQPIESNVFRTNRTVAAGLSDSLVSGISSTALPVTSFTPRAYDVAGYTVPERVGQYGASVQQELPGNTVLTVAYVGSQGRNLFQRSITNKILPGATTINAGAALPAGVGVVNEIGADGRVNRVTTIREFDAVGFRLNSAGQVVPSAVDRLNPFGEIDYKTSGGRDSYNAMQVTINRRFTQGLTLGGQYQWGHSIGTTQGSNEAQTVQDPYSFDNERGNNTFDIRHSANLSVLYELPFGAGRRYDLSGVANTLLSGIQIGGVYNGRSGTPLDIRISRPDVVAQCQQANCTLGTATVPNGFVISLPSTISATSPLPAGFFAVVNTPGGNASRNTRRPDLIAGVDPFIEQDGVQFLNPAAFTIPRPGTYGNLGRGALYGPTFHQFDLTLQKRFPITERTNIEFRTEFYNILNRANFANPPASLPSNLGGSATSQQPGQPFALPSEGVTARSAGNFGLINGTVGRTVGLGTNRQIQFALRLNF